MSSAEIPVASAAAARRRDRSRRLPRWLRATDVVLPAAALLVIAVACFAWPAVFPVPSPVGGNVLESNQALFAPGHWLGTDLNGNDTWSRLLHGGRVSLLIAVAVNAIGLAAGGSLGVLSAYAGRMADAIMMRILDVLMSLPSLVLVLAVAQSLGPSETNTIAALLFFSVPAFARVARAATLRMRDEPYLLVARVSGTKTWRVLALHIAPNVLPQLTTFALLGMGVVIVIEGALSFLGLGVPPPFPSWGNMIFQGQRVLLTKPDLVLLPSAMLFLTVLSCNLLGESLRARWESR